MKFISAPWRSGIIAYPVEAAEISGAASPSGCMLFTATFLRQFGLDPAQLLAIEVEDDDMAPLLTKGGCAVADLRKRRLVPGGIFAFPGANGPPLLRRVTLGRENTWFKRRDMPDDTPVSIRKGEKALGQVVWASRMDF